MEKTQTPSTRPTPREEDVDLGQLFYKTGGAINTFFGWIALLFKAIGDLILTTLFFLRRNLLWLAIGTAIGIGYGFYLTKRDGANYFSTMTVQANYNSSRALYSTVDYFNALVSDGQTADLKKIFNISDEEAASLNSFSVQPVVTELITAEMYKNRFLNLYHNTRLRMDTFWVKTISYKEFKSSLTKYDYPIHQVRVNSSNSTIFSKLQQGIISTVSANELLQEGKQSGNESNRQEVALLESSLRSLDTLKVSYNKRLSAGSSKEGTNVTLLDGNVAVANPELQLYDKILQLKDELKMVKSQAVVERDILQVYAPFSAVGQSAGLLETKIVKYAYIFLLLTLALLLLIEFYKFLKTAEENQRRKKSPGTAA